MTKNSRSDAYAASGVDITAGYKAVQLMKEHVGRTVTDGVMSDVGGFGGLFLSVHQKWLWKGTDAGSGIEDPYKTVRKRFVHDAPLVYTVTPAVGYRGRHLAFMGEFGLGDEKSVNVRTSFMW